MRTDNFLLTLFLLSNILVPLGLVHGSTPSKKHYVVYMGEHLHPNSESMIKANHELLSSVIESFDKAQEVAVYHYTKSFRGFSAMLTQEQAQLLSESDSVVSLFESRMNKLHTTRSWEFLEFSSLYGNNQMMMPSMASSTSDIIVGVVDTGVWPESDSFRDAGLGPVPAKFKGTCVTGENFTAANCNRKIIGARYYYKGFEAENGPLESIGRTFFRSARDADGHGSHTASTIAGAEVPNASLYGLARGTARGGATNARLAIYKACWFGMCSDADILAAMDDAIHDGVDVFSISLGPGQSLPTYFEDPVTVGAFHAFQKGVFVACSAGNSFFPGTVANAAPWILTVAASSIDREFQSNVYLGNWKVLKGFSLNPFKMTALHGLIAGSDAAAPGFPAKNASFCKNNTLDHTKIKGKIVVCKTETLQDDRIEKAETIQKGGGVGMILVDPMIKGLGIQFPIPATLIGHKQAQKLQAYILAEKYPTARIAPTITVLNTKPAPKMAVFSSKGPNTLTPDLIKPDITAPGLNILAAWSPVAIASTSGRSINYNIISGTSMSCPHVAAVAAILRSYHPSWSPAAVMSAIMTTATTIDNTFKLIGRYPNGTQATPFDYGSGHVNPAGSLNPGLVYDFNAKDIFNFLCSNGATPAQLKNLTDHPTYCKKHVTPSYDFNYPSIGVSNMRGNVSVHRTVTYYGIGHAVYFASVYHPSGVQVNVTPNTLRFNKTGEKLSFRVNLTPVKTSNGKFVFGTLTWKSGHSRVRSPIGLKVISM